MNCTIWSSWGFYCLLSFQTDYIKLVELINLWWLRLHIKQCCEENHPQGWETPGLFLFAWYTITVLQSCCVCVCFFEEISSQPCQTDRARMLNAHNSILSSDLPALQSASFKKNSFPFLQPSLSPQWRHNKNWTVRNNKGAPTHFKGAV